MNCSQLEKLIALHVEGDLPARRRAGLTEHLRTCTRCQEFAGTIRASQLLVKGLAQDAVEATVFEQVRHRVLNALPAEKEQSGFHAWRYALVAGVLLGVLVLARVAPRHPSNVRVTAVAPRPRELTNTESAERAGASPHRSPVGVIKAGRRSRPQRHSGTTLIASRRMAPKPLKVKLITNDPKIVIYWLFE
jgi:anti-sigma factor RsiW